MNSFFWIYKIAISTVLPFFKNSYTRIWFLECIRVILNPTELYLNIKLIRAVLNCVKRCVKLHFWRGLLWRDLWWRGSLLKIYSYVMSSIKMAFSILKIAQKCRCKIEKMPRRSRWTIWSCEFCSETFPSEWAKVSHSSEQHSDLNDIINLIQVDQRNTGALTDLLQYYDPI